MWKREAEKRLVEREVKSILKFGSGSLIMWGCMLWDRSGQTCKINGRIDKELYVQILEDKLLGTLEEYDLEIDNVIF